MKVNVIRYDAHGAEHIENVRYTDELLEAGVIPDEQELELAEAGLNAQVRYWLGPSLMLQRAY